MKRISAKVVRAGKGTVFVVGLSVVLAAVFGVASMALAANGKPFLLGRNNAATALTTLVKQGPGPAMRLLVRPGNPPMVVNSQVKVANLNADKLDGQDAGAFAASGHDHDDRYLGKSGKAPNSDALDGRDSTSFADASHGHDERYFSKGESDGRYLSRNGKAADADKLDGKDSAAFIEGGPSGLGGSAAGSAIAVNPGEFINIFETPNFRVAYECPGADITNNNGRLRIRNLGTQTVNVFSDNGGTNPNHYGSLAPDAVFDQGAAAGGEFVTFGMQGTYVATIQAFSVHRASDNKCHIQTQALTTR